MRKTTKAALERTAFEYEAERNVVGRINGAIDLFQRFISSIQTPE